ncbi:MAG: MMPL family transporter [Candidatus Latescibacteria bacterium]|nr:MMPL family transporter [Candidatus Latescibacterota bacterium]NIM21439.1 MMPL family transporter [Candidatus Latescibacterota bacterium]NIM65620.1 MMPL family transporter [Candidatus Latescibacterota bacterium]NIO02001.1 MMPL family transporter [Candidatus Latescibacterota bacterium]NIO28813.1 MMPL family transporter [Candidatus Latescibacterota bacterium]
MTLPELAIKRHVTMFMILVSLVVLGGVALFRLPLAFLPDVEEPHLFVRVPYPNASPEQIERMIVRPVEDALGSVKGLEQMWSNCDQEGGMIRLQFDWSIDMKLARVEVWEKIDRIRRDLPDDIGDIMVSTHWGDRDADMPIMEGRLSSKRDLSESYDLLERKIIKPLERIPGVAQVRLDGVNPREVRINLRVADLEAHSMDIREVWRILRSSNFDQSLGKVTEGDTRYSLRTVATFKTVEEIQNLILRDDGLKLKDVADVVYEEPPLEYGRHLDGDFAIGITVSQESKANTVEVCGELERRVAAMSEDPELEGVNFLVWFSQGREIKKTLKDLMFTGIIGAILASLILFGFLRRFSTTTVSVLCIPFSLIVACGFIWARGNTLNTLTLLGLIVGIGMLVDNAVVVMENIFRHQELGYDQKSAARLGAREVSTAVTAATLTSVIVFLPLIYNKPSEMNIYLKELGITVCLTLLASLFISQTLIPLATSWFIKSKPRPRGRLITALETRYERLLRFNLNHRWLTPIIGILVLSSAVYPFMKVDKNFDTSESELFVQLRYDISEEMSLEKKEELVNEVERHLEPYRDALKARSIYSFWSDRWTLTRVYLREGDATQENIARVRSLLRQLLPEIAGVKLEVQENRQHWRHDRGKRIAFQIVGEDSEVLSVLAKEARQRLEAIPGLMDTFSGSEEGRQELHVELDRELATRYGISPIQPAEVVGLTFRGRRLQRFRTPDGEREMRLTLDEKEHETVSQLQNLPLWTTEGEKVPLASIADFREVPGEERIQRDNRLTSTWVGASYESGTREQYMPLVAAALNGMDFPYGYSWTFGRWQQWRREKSVEFLINLLLALLLVFAVMAGLFESVRQAIALMIALPFALSGAIWTLYFTGTDFDQPAAVGLLLLIGIVVNNGIVMIEHINSYRRKGMPRFEAMIKGGRERLRPILMTALTTLLSLVPIVIQKPSLGSVYYYSMALVIIGGLFISTFLTSVLLPTNASLVEDSVPFLIRSAKAVGRTLRFRPRSHH